MNLLDFLHTPHSFFRSEFAFLLVILRFPASYNSFDVLFSRVYWSVSWIDFTLKVVFVIYVLWYFQISVYIIFSRSFLLIYVTSFINWHCITIMIISLMNNINPCILLLNRFFFNCFSLRTDSNFLSVLNLLFEPNSNPILDYL